MSHGPRLTCFGCDALEEMYTAWVCRAVPVPRMLDFGGNNTPDWCPLRAEALEKLRAVRRDEKPLLGGDYGFSNDGEDPDD